MGALIMGRLIEDAFIQRMSEQIRLKLELYSGQSTAIVSDLMEKLSDQKYAYLTETEESGLYKDIYSAIGDLTGEKALLLKAQHPRRIVQTGYATTFYATFFFLATMATALVAMVLLIHWLVVKPVLKLKDNVISAREDNQKMPDIISRQDEIGILGREFKGLLSLVEDRSSKLEALNSKLIVDINKRKEAEKALLESEEQLKTVLESMPVGVFVNNHEGNYRMVNDVGCNITGYSREELLRMNIRDVDPVEYTDQQKEMVARQFDTKGHYVFESINIRKDGTRLPVEVHITEITLNNESLLLSLVLDITDRKQDDEVRRITEEQRARSKKNGIPGINGRGRCS